MRCGGSIRCWRKSGAAENTIANLQVFSEGLARNTGKLDGIVAGLEKMTGGGAPAAPKITYDLRAPRRVSGPGEQIPQGAIGIPEPTAVAMLETQRLLFSPAKEYPGFAERVGRQHSEAAAGQIDRELRKLRYRACAVAHNGCRAGGLSASDRCPAVPDRDGSRTCRRDRIVGDKSSTRMERS